MIIHYLDPSAWVKRYFEEVGSEAASTVFDDAECLACSTFGIPEIAATIARKGRHENLTRETLDALIAQAREDFLLFERVSLSDEMVGRAELLAFEHRLRAGDAVHLASALFLTLRQDSPQVTMVSTDAELLAAAKSKGLSVTSPGRP